MKESKMVKAIGKVGDKYINESINYKSKKKNIVAGVMSFVAAAACFVFVLNAAFLKQGNVADSVVSIDINPSIEVKVSKTDKILSVKPLNADAKKVLEGMELENVDLDTGINAIVGSLLKNGYLDEVYNAINVCVENDNEKRADELSEKVSNEINNLFKENDLIGNVSAQACTYNAAAQKVAESYGISVGKLYLAQTVAENTGMEVEQAGELSVSELWDLADAEEVTLVSKEEALQLVLTDANVSETDITEVSVKIHETKGEFHYDIRFKVGEGKEYKYKVDAVNNVIIEYEFKLLPETPADPPTPDDRISKTEALAIAYEDAGVNEADVVLDELKHKPVEKEYHIEFSVGNYDYIYVIHAEDGSIISKEVIEMTDSDVTEETPTAKITFNQALQIALEMAGVQFEELTMYDIKYHAKKDGKIEYKVHFHVDKTHYEFTVNALTGECVEKKRPEPPIPPHKKEEAEKPVPPHEKEKPEKPVPPHEKEEVEKPVPPHEKDEAEKPVPPHEKEEVEKPVAPHKKEETEKPVLPHEKEGVEKPVPPHEKEGAEKPVPPHEKEEAEKSVASNEEEETVEIAAEPEVKKVHKKAK